LFFLPFIADLEGVEQKRYKSGTNAEHNTLAGVVYWKRGKRRFKKKRTKRRNI